MENLSNKKPNPAVRAADFICKHVFRSGGWSELSTIALDGQHSLADAALQDTVEFEPIVFPHGLTLKDPPEHGWNRPAA